MVMSMGHHWNQTSEVLPSTYDLDMAPDTLGLDALISNVPLKYENELYN